MLLTAAQVVTPARILAPGWLRLEGDRIAEVGEGAPPRAGRPRPRRRDRRPRLRRHPRARRRRRVLRQRYGGRGRRGGRDPPRPRHHVDGGEPGHRHPRADGRRRPRAGPARAGRPARRHPPRGAVAEPAALRAPTSPARSPTPDPASVDALLDAGDGAVRMVTLAPELPGGLDAVRRLVDAGVRRRDRPHRRDVRRGARRRSTRAPGSAPTSSTRCARSTTATPARSARCSTPPPTSSSSPTACTCTPPCCARSSRPSPGAASWSPTRWRPRARPTATTGSARWPSRCATASPGSPTDGDGAIAGSTLTMDAAVRFAVRDGRAAAARRRARRQHRTRAGLGPRRRRRPRGRPPGRPRRARRRPRGGAGDARGGVDDELSVSPSSSRGSGPRRTASAGRRTPPAPAARR